MNSTTKSNGQAKIAVNGVRLQHTSARGIRGVHEVIKEAMTNFGWAESLTTVQIVSRMDETGKMIFEAYNVVSMENEEEGGFPILLDHGE